MRRRLDIFGMFLCFAIGFLPLMSAAQSTDSKHDLELLEEQNSIVTEQNPAYLHYLNSARIANAQLIFQQENGKLTRYFQSPNSSKIQINTSSYLRYSPNVVLYGKIEYLRQLKRELGGSALLNPQNAPFDILETTNDNRGNKNLELYNLVGGISIKSFKKLNWGAKVDYTGGNYSKRRDLRHINKLFDMKATFGLSYNITPKIELGLNYLYRKSVEGLYFNSYGKMDKTFYSLIDFGNFYGREEVFVELGDGFVAGKKERPLYDRHNGAALQMIYHTPFLTLYNQLGYSSRFGSYGIPTDYSPLYTVHSGKDFSWNGEMKFSPSPKSLHIISASVNIGTLNNFLNIYNTMNTIGGTSTVKYFGKNLILDRNDLDISLLYSFYKNSSENPDHYDWKISLKSNLHSRTDITSIYPYRRESAFTQHTNSLQFLKNISLRYRASELQLGATLHFVYGFGTPYTDSFYATPSRTERAPDSGNIYMQKEIDYFTKPQLGAALHCKYSARFKSKNLFPYVRGEYRYLQMINGDKEAELLNRQKLTVAFGLNF